MQNKIPTFYQSKTQTICMKNTTEQNMFFPYLLKICEKINSLNHYILTRDAK